MKNTQIIFSIFVLVLYSVVSTAQEDTDLFGQSDYVVDRPISINVLNLSNFTLQIINDQINYSILLENPNTFTPNISGDYLAVLYTNDTEISRDNFTVKDRIDILLEKQVYDLKESVRILLYPNRSDINLKIYFQNESYQYLGFTSGVLDFRPQRTGNYTINVTAPEQSSTKIFIVEKINDSKYLILDSEYDISQLVGIIVENISTPFDLLITDNISTYNYPNLNVSSINFKPENLGNYTVYLSTNKTILEKKSFEVKNLIPVFDIAINEPVEFILNFTEYAEGKKNFLDRILGLSTLTRVTSVVEGYEDDPRFKVKIGALSQTAFQTRIEPTSQVNPGLYTLITQAIIKGETVNTTLKFNWYQINNTIKEQELDYKDILALNFDINENAIFHANFTTEIEESRNILEKIFRAGKIDTLVTYVVGHENDRNFQTQIEQINDDDYIITLPASKNISPNIYALNVIALADGEEYNKTMVFNWGLTNYSQILEKLSKISTNKSIDVEVQDSETPDLIEPTINVTLNNRSLVYSYEILEQNQSHYSVIIKNSQLDFAIQINHVSFSGGEIVISDSYAPPNTSVKRSYSISPSLFNFENITLKLLADGPRLHYCDLQECEFNSIQTIPGDEYEITTQESIIIAFEDAVREASVPTEIKVFREQPNNIHINRENEMVLRIVSNSPIALSLEERLPPGWTVSESSGDVDGRRIRYDLFLEHNITTVRYSAISPDKKTNSKFDTDLEYGTQKRSYEYRVNVDEENSFTDSDLRIYDNLGEVRQLATDIWYKANYTVSLIGQRSVTDFPSILNIPIPEGIEIRNLQCPNAGINNYNGSTSIYCEWQPFNAGDKKIIYFELRSVDESEYVLLSNLTYDPPKDIEFETIKDSEEKIKLEPEFVEDDLLVNIETEAENELPIAISGNINYLLSEQSVSKIKTSSLLVENYAGENFNLIVGSEVISIKEAAIKPSLFESIWDFIIEIFRSIFSLTGFAIVSESNELLEEPSDEPTEELEDPIVEEELPIEVLETEHVVPIEENIEEQENTGPFIGGSSSSVTSGGSNGGTNNPSPQNPVQTITKKEWFTTLEGHIFISKDVDDILNQSSKVDREFICEICDDYSLMENKDITVRLTAHNFKSVSNSVLTEYVPNEFDIVSSDGFISAINASHNRIVWTTGQSDSPIIREYVIRTHGKSPSAYIFFSKFVDGNEMTKPKEHKVYVNPIEITLDNIRSNLKPITKIKNVKQDTGNQIKIDVEVARISDKINHIVFNNLTINKNQNLDLRFDDVLEPSQKLAGSNFVKLFSLDPTDINFTDGEIVATARGTKLLKCAQWNFDGRECEGEWVEVLNLTPGEQYRVPIDPQDPAWAEEGLVAINTHKSIYLPGELAKVGIGVLDHLGHVVCNATVNLEVTKPSGDTMSFSTENGSIHISDQCVILGVTTEPDYFTNFTVNEIGSHQMFLNATTYDGNPIMISNFSVKTEVPFDVERIGATRVFPFVPYNYSIRVTANQAYTGNITELVPNNFEISNTTATLIPNEYNQTLIVWDVDLEVGETVYLNYTFDAPDISPYLYEFGPLQIGAFKEERTWQIANDAKTLNSVAMESPTVTQNLGLGDTFIIQCAPSCSGAGGQPTVTISFQWCTVSGCGSSNTISTNPATSDVISVADNVIADTCNSNPGNTWSETVTTRNVGAVWVRCNGVEGPRTADSGTILVNVTADLPPELSDGISPNPFINNSNVFNGDTLYFNSTWTDDVSLANYWFEWNGTGTLTNASTGSLSGLEDLAEATATVTEAAGNTVRWRFFASDSAGQIVATDIQTFVVGSLTDDIAPNIDNPSVSPTQSVAGDIFNLSVEMSDNIGINTANAEVTFPNQTRINYSMSPIGADVYQYLFAFGGGGNFSVIFHAVDGNGNSNNTAGNPQYFNQSSRNISITGYFFEKGQLIGIDGFGFSAGYQANLQAVHNQTLQAASGLSSTTNVNSSGRFYEIWTVPTTGTTTLGGYDITATDSTGRDYIGNSTSVIIALKPDNATDDGGDDAFNAVNETDTTRIFLDASGGEQYVELNYSNNLPLGTVVDNTTIYIQHYEASAGYNYVLQWYDGLSYVNICTLPNRNGIANEGFDVCHINEIDTQLEGNFISLRYTDNNGLSGNDDSTLNAIFIVYNTSITTETLIQVNSPVDVVKYYNFSDTTNNEAWYGATTLQPITTIDAGTSLTSAELDLLSQSDDDRFNSDDQQDQFYSFHLFSFRISEAAENINSMLANYEGYAVQGTGAVAAADGYYVYIYNYTNSTYSYIDLANPGTLGQDVISSNILSGNLSSYVNSSGHIRLLVEGQNTSIIAAGRQNTNVTTDFTEVVLNKVRALSGDALINITAIDADGINTCQYRYNNDSGPLQYVGMENLGGDYWTNISDTTTYADGFYTINFNCTDGIGNFNSNSSTKIRIDNNDPIANSISPANLTNYSVTNVTVFWNVTDVGGGNLECNVYLDGLRNTSNNIIVESGQNSSYTLQNMNEGPHLWYANCTDIADNQAISEQRNFTIDITNPTVNLNLPTDGSFFNYTNVTFNYTATDQNGMDLCTLIIDDVANISNSSVSNGGFSFISVGNFVEGLHNWTVNCVDFAGNSGNTTAINFSIDLTAPNITLEIPTPDQIVSSSNFDLNFTVVDNLASYVDCYVLLDGANNKSATFESGIRNNFSIEGLNEGSHQWNVTCTDPAYKLNVSQTRNFFVDLPPNVTLEYPENNFASQFRNFTFNYTPVETYGLYNCSLYIDGTFNQSNSSLINNGAENSFGLLNNLSEALHTWYVGCADNSSNIGVSEVYNLTVDYTIPTIDLVGPINNTNFSTSTIEVNFTVIDNLDIATTCTVFVNETIRASNVNATNNSLTRVNITNLPSGNNVWYVSCMDDAGNTNTSATWIFNITGAPAVNLFEPTNATYSTDTEFNFTYFLNKSAPAITSCELYFNGVQNRTNTTILSTDSSAPNNFSVDGFVESRTDWYVQCTDDAGSSAISPTWVLFVDQTPPVINLTAPDPGEQVTNSTIDFNFTTFDNFSPTTSCDIYINGLQNNTGSQTVLNNTASNFTLEGFNEGTYNWSVLCTDLAGLSNQTLNRSFTVNLAPIVNLNQPADSSYQNSANITYDFILIETFGINTCDLFIDGIYNQSNSTLLTLGSNNFFNTTTNITQGAHNWSVVCSDNLGQNNTPTNNSFIVDSILPTINLTGPDDGEILASSEDILFEWIAIDFIDPTLSCDLRINGILNETGVNSDSGVETNTSVSGFNSGSYLWNVTCTDDATNFNTSETKSFTITEIPSIALENPADNGGFQTQDLINLTFSVSSATDLSSCSLYIDHLFNQSNSSVVVVDANNNFTVNRFEEGNYTWRVSCLDILGFEGTSPNQTFDIDLTDPNVTIHNPFNGSTVFTGTVTFNFTATDNLDSSLNCDLTTDGVVNVSDIAAPNGTHTTEQIVNFTEGLHYWNVTCSDNSGRSFTSPTWEFFQSFQPNATLVSPDVNYSTFNDVINFTFIPQDNEATLLECRVAINGLINGTPLNNPVSDQLIFKNISGFNEGEYNWTVICTDNDLNEIIPPNRTFFVDFTTPNTVAFSPNNTLFTQSSVEFNFTVSDNLAVDYNCSIAVNNSFEATELDPQDGVPYLYNITGLRDGYFLWNTTCIDTAGNVNVSNTLNFTVAEPPTVILGDPLNASRTNNSNRTFYFTPYDNSGNISNCAVVLNGITNASNTSINVTNENLVFMDNMSHGEYLWNIECTDFNQNFGQNDTDKTFFIDKLGPSIDLNSPYQDEIFNEDDIYFNLTPTDQFGFVIDISCDIFIDGIYNVTTSPIESGEWNRTHIQDLNIGRHNWSATCSDDFGNTNATANISFIVNAPDLTLNQSDMSFNNTNPIEEEQINITATIHNTGGNPANNASALIIDWNGTVERIIGNFSLTLEPGENTVISQNFSLYRGLHEIIVTLDRDNLVVELNDSNNNQSLNITLLLADIISPPNETLQSSQILDLDFIPYNYYDTPIYYSIYIDDVYNFTNVSTDKQLTNVLLTLNEGSHEIIVEVNETDILDSPNIRRQNSTRLFVTIDPNAPSSNITIPNATYFADLTPTITYNITDAIDSSINYTFFLDGEVETFGYVFSGLENSTTLGPLAEGEYVAIVQGQDDAGNVANSSPITFFVDITNPSINISTLNNSNFSDLTPEIFYNASDNLATQLNYSFYVDDVLDQNGTTSLGTGLSQVMLTQSEGTYEITLEATDQAGNIANSTPITISIDISAPLISIITPTAGSVEGYDVFIDADVSDSGVGVHNVTYQISNESSIVLENGTLLSPLYTTTWQSLNDIDNSSHIYFVNLTVFANDTLGNTDNVTVRFIIDNRNPDITFIEPNENYVNSSFNLSVLIQNYNLTESNYTISNATHIQQQNQISSIFNPNYNWTDFVNVSNTTLFPEGIYNLTVYAEDSAQNNRTARTFFTVDRTAPSINLNLPINNSNYSISSLTFNFTTTDTVDSTLTCNITIADVLEDESFASLSGISTNRSIVGLSEGYQSWYVSCMDGAGNRENSIRDYFTIDLTNPEVLLNNPANYTFNSSNNISFEFTPIDYQTEIESCTLELNGVDNITIFRPGNNTVNNISFSNLNSARYDWNVRCVDYSGNEGQNQTITLFVDLENPTANILTANGTSFGINNPNITINMTDNLDTILNYTIFVNALYDDNGTILNDTITNATLTYHDQGIYEIITQAEDEAGRIANSSPINITIDTEPPTINLLAPVNDSIVNTSIVFFNFTVNDNFDWNIDCELAIDEVINESFTAFPGISNNISIANFTGGIHNWSVTCFDNVPNINTSEQRIFNVTIPDVAIYSSNITFNISEPEEGENVTIFANVMNVGESDLVNVRVEIFNGSPSAGLLLEEFLVSIPIGENITVQTAAPFGIGDYDIFVRLDSNNIFSETDETNNLANNTLNVALWNEVYGNITGDLELALNLSGTRLFAWATSNSTTGSIFAVDSDSEITWTNISALSRNISGDFSADDFDQLDIALNSSGYSDSINRTFTENSVPINTGTFFIFGSYIENIPLINSTNVSSFLTGILYDQSDTTYGEYNGSHDLIFVTQINKSQQGAYGLYDYELRVPATLRNLIGPDRESITFYVELR